MKTCISAESCHNPDGASQPKSNFYKHKGCADGLKKKCKKCICADRKAYAQANPETIKARSDKYQKENREEINARRNTRYAADPEYFRKLMKKSRNQPGQKEKRAADNKAWREKNAEYCKAKDKEKREANPEKIAARNKAWRLENIDRQREREREYRQNPENKERTRKYLEQYRSENAQLISDKNKASHFLKCQVQDEALLQIVTDSESFISDDPSEYNLFNNALYLLSNPHNNILKLGKTNGNIPDRIKAHNGIEKTGELLGCADWEVVVAIQYPKDIRAVDVETMVHRKLKHDGFWVGDSLLGHAELFECGIGTILGYIPQGSQADLNNLIRRR